MFLVTKELNGKEEIRVFPIDNPRFNIDEIRKIKTLVRFGTNQFTNNTNIDCDLSTVLKYGRCIEYSWANKSLYEMKVRLAGREHDTVYTLRIIYGGEFNIQTTVIDAKIIDRGRV